MMRRESAMTGGRSDQCFSDEQLFAWLDCDMLLRKLSLRQLPQCRAATGWVVTIWR